LDNVKKLIVGGCSFTAGDELADFNDDLKTQGIIRPRSESTWANCLQRELFPNATVDNTAISGCDYGAIVRRIIYQTRRMMNIWPAEDIRVAVMWTSMIRREYPTIYPDSHKLRDDEDRFLYSLPSDGDGVTLGPNSSWMVSRRKMWANEKLVRTHVEFYSRRATADNHIYYPLQQLEYLTSWLKANGVKYYYTSAFNDLQTVKTSPENIFYEDMIKRLKIHESIFLQNGLGFWDWAKHNNYECGAFADHPLEQAHIDWAKDFAKWILTKQ
jgi:hypothetical protein